MHLSHILNIERVDQAQESVVTSIESIRSDCDFRTYWIALCEVNFQGRVEVFAYSDTYARLRRYDIVFAGVQDAKVF